MRIPAQDTSAPSDPGAPDVWAAQAAIARQLAAWSAVSIAGGSAAALAGRARGDPVVHAFGSQNAAWGAIDLVVAGAGELGRRRAMAADSASDPAVQEAQRRSLRRVLLVNAGLDVGYVAVGLGGLIWARMRGPAPAITGHAAAVVLQGGFLLAFDTFHARALTDSGAG